MSYRTVEDMLSDPKIINPRHNTNLGSPLLKLEGLIVAMIENSDFNTVLKRGLRTEIDTCKRKNKAKFDALMKEYGGLLGRKK